MFHSEAAIAIVLALKLVEVIRSLDGERCAGCLRPVEPEETSGATHLVLSVHHYRVVNGGAGETVVPRRLAVIEIGTGVASDIEAVPPEIDVQLIGLERTTSVASGANESPRVCAADAMVARGRSGTGLFWFRECVIWSRGTDAGGLRAQPRRSFVPRSGFQDFRHMENTGREG